MMPCHVPRNYGAARAVDSFTQMTHGSYFFLCFRIIPLFCAFQVFIHHMETTIVCLNPTLLHYTLVLAIRRCVILTAAHCSFEFVCRRTECTKMLQSGDIMLSIH